MEHLLWILLSSVFVSLHTVFCCEFPTNWHGRWYQSTFGDITISSDTMSRKGRCIQKDGDKYLISSQNCYRCLVITQWHTNILQYKQSRCWSVDTIDAVCSKINGDASLYSMVRVPSKPVPCPFQGHYTFSYSNNTTGSRQCYSSPPSEIRACADESKFKFVYRHCPGMPETFNKELDFQCLATWENGEKYLYGKFTSHQLSGREQMYRCFMHSFYGMSGEMSMTADATCQGLQSPTVGFSTMKLDKVLDSSKWPRGLCRYPDFFTRRQRWRDLSGRFIIEADIGLQIFRIKDKFPSNYIEYRDVERDSEVKMVVRCVEHVDRHPGPIKKYIGHITDDTCESGFRCVMLKKRSHKVLELIIGNPMNDLRTDCNSSHFIGAQKHILLPDSSKTIKCPTEGSFDYMDKASDCRGKFNIGCKSEKEMEIVSSCNTNEQTAKAEILQCLVQWKEEGTHYVIVQKSGDVRKAATCLAFRHTQNGLDVQEDNQCGTNRVVIRNGIINYILFKPADTCEAVPANVPSPPTDTLPPKGITSDRSSIIDAGNTSSNIRTSSYSLVLLVVFHVLWNR